MGITANSIDYGFVQPTQDLLDELGPGCFVHKMEVNGDSCWVEITSVVDAGFECIAHPALIENQDMGEVSEGDPGILRREQISALGCERFCSC